MMRGHGHRHGTERHCPGISCPRIMALILYSAFLMFCFACSGETEGRQKHKTAPPVTVAAVIQKDVPIQLITIGNVEPYASVAIKSLVDGQVTKTAFQEGQEVNKGDLLFVVDPRPFEAAMKQAEAILERDLSAVKQAQANQVSSASQLKHAEAILTKDRVEAKTARVQAERYGALAGKGNVSKDEYDQVQMKAHPGQAFKTPASNLTTVTYTRP